ncbi:MAG: aldo/keto reductase [Armatimonadota bacterium]|nr:aldo/keto reductase [Armatimonadota bacterium]
MPVLGFGCSSLMGHGTPQERMAVLETAFDSGIRHFDVARFYGFGEAEGALGDFIQSRRTEVTVTTKFGISPPAQSSALKSVLGLARRVAAKSPLLRRGMAGTAKKLVKGGNFSVAEAQSSLETSLRLLKTDYIDLYLLHDCRVEDATDELLQFLQRAVQEGKIRRFGVGTEIEVIVELCREKPEFTGVVQFENSVLRPNLTLLPEPEKRVVITHRALNESFDLLWEFFAADPAAARRWSEKLGTDCTNREVVGHLMLNYAVQVNSGGLVLFSSRSRSRIQSNVRAVETSPFSAEQLTLFAGIVEEPGLIEKNPH